MGHKNLIEFLNEIKVSKFSANLGESGGYVSFQNSGQRGSIKEFTLSIESILKGIEDIISNHSEFKKIEYYVEKDWRDAGAKYFSDLSLNSIITVQTKPTFTTFSKLICWANDIDYVGDSRIELDLKKLSVTKEKLVELIESYKPKKEYKTKFKNLLKGPLKRLPKPFILLAGISGTGKTRFVRKQASAYNVGSCNYCLVPVRPDWHEPSDLLGYVSRIGSKPKYVSTKVLQFIIDAWKVVAPSASRIGTGELHLSSPPYWLCLDEMNLAPVEQYFADYISVLESRKFADGEYSCEALLDKSILNNDEYDIQADLNLSDDAELWDYFCEFGIGIPPNLIVAGTVNMDETTHGFSRKVIDRALTIDFGEFYPNEYDKFFKGQAEPKILTYGVETRAKLETIDCIADPKGSDSIEFLDAVNNVLEGTPFQLAYRALNELLLFVNSFAPDSQEKLQAVWDDFLMTKVLPRIDGDEDKLRITRDGDPTNLLKELEKTLEEQLNLIWSDDKKRIDLFRVDAKKNEIKDISCRSKKKIKWMNERLEANTFTSYWP